MKQPLWFSYRNWKEDPNLTKKSDLFWVHNLIKDLHFFDIADLLERVDKDNRSAMINVLRDGFDAEILGDLDVGVGKDDFYDAAIDTIKSRFS